MTDGLLAKPTPPQPAQKPGDASGQSTPPPAAPKFPPGTTLNKDSYCFAANQAYCGGGIMCGEDLAAAAAAYTKACDGPTH